MGDVYLSGIIVKLMTFCVNVFDYYFFGSMGVTSQYFISSPVMDDTTKPSPVKDFSNIFKT